MIYALVIFILHLLASSRGNFLREHYVKIWINWIEHLFFNSSL